MAYDVDNVDTATEIAPSYSFKPLGNPVTIDKGPNTGIWVVYLRNNDGISIEFIKKVVKSKLERRQAPLSGASPVFLSLYHMLSPYAGAGGYPKSQCLRGYRHEHNRIQDESR